MPWALLTTCHPGPGRVDSCPTLAPSPLGWMVSPPTSPFQSGSHSSTSEGPGAANTAQPAAWPRPRPGLPEAALTAHLVGQPHPHLPTGFKMRISRPWELKAGIGPVRGIPADSDLRASPRTPGSLSPRTLQTPGVLCVLSRVRVLGHRYKPAASPLSSFPPHMCPGSFPQTGAVLGAELWGRGFTRNYQDGLCGDKGHCQWQVTSVSKSVPYTVTRPPLK